MLLFLVLEFDFLHYAAPDGVGYCPFILLCVSVDFNADVFWFKMVVSADFVKPYGGICP
jgi:hypothetical protein